MTKKVTPHTTHHNNEQRTTVKKGTSKEKYTRRATIQIIIFKK